MFASSPMIKNFGFALLCSALIAATPAISHAENEIAPKETSTEEVSSEETTAETVAETKEDKGELVGDLMKFIDGDYMLGNPDAPVIIIEYASLSCTHCASFHNDIFPLLNEKYIETGKAALIYRHFPFNDPALKAAMLANCAGEEGGTKKFFAFLKALFGAQDKWAFDNSYETRLRTLANVGGMSGEAYDSCVADQANQERIVAGVKWASERLKVNSTPTLFINGEMVQGNRSIDRLSEIIDKELDELGAK